MATKLQEWFIFLGNSSEKVKSYETDAEKFYRLLYANKPNKDSALANTFIKPLQTKFYKKEMSKFLSYIGGVIINGIKLGLILGLSVLLVVLGLGGFSYMKTNSGQDTVIKLLLAGVKQSLVKGIIFSILTLLLCIGICILIRYLSLNSLSRKLSKQEVELEKIVKSIPPKYRNSESMDLLYRIYYERSDINMSQALDVVDSLMRDKGSSRTISAVMFDVPFENEYSEVTVNNNIDNKQTYVEDNDEEENTVKNPALPEDISTHTFSGSEDAEKDLQSMIGLESVKQQIETLKNRIQFYGSADVGSGGSHMVFMGAAGTGKTTVARIVTKILYDFGYIKKNKCIEISGDYLKSPYNGQTGDRTAAIVEYAMGGVLFIDEAYLLYESGNSASQEATGVLLKAMEDHRKDLVVILAGYEEQMTKLLVSNEGFASRIKYKIHFPNYTIEEMYQIFTMFINKYNNRIYIVEDDAKQLLFKTFELEQKSRFFGNARTVRNAVDAVMDHYADRCVKEGTKEATIKLQDVQLYAQDREKELQSELRNASATNQLDESIIRLAELKPKIKPGSENPEADLQQLIGLDNIRKEIELLKSQKEFYGEEYTGQQQNILLIGPEGCGKTSVTTVLTGFLYKFGYIRENRYLDINADFLKGSYVGHTSRRADSIISYARGGVLYIRNVSMLVSNNSSDSFGMEAMSAIITALTNNPDLVIIIADSSINALQNVKNLFSIVYEFPKYSANELLQIFNICAYKDNFQVRQETFEKLNAYLMNTNIVSVRDVIQLYNNTKKNHINNYTGGDNKFIIEPQDLIINVQPNQTGNTSNTETTGSSGPKKLKLNISH